MNDFVFIFYTLFDQSLCPCHSLLLMPLCLGLWCVILWKLCARARALVAHTDSCTFAREFMNLARATSTFDLFIQWEFKARCAWRDCNEVVCRGIGRRLAKKNSQHNTHIHFECELKERPLKFMIRMGFNVTEINYIDCKREWCHYSLSAFCNANENWSSSARQLGCVSFRSHNA